MSSRSTHARDHLHRQSSRGHLGLHRSVAKIGRLRAVQPSHIYRGGSGKSKCLLCSPNSDKRENDILICCSSSGSLLHSRVPRRLALLLIRHASGSCTKWQFTKPFSVQGVCRPCRRDGATEEATGASFSQHAKRGKQVNLIASCYIYCSC